MQLLPNWNEMCAQTQAYILMTVAAFVVFMLLAERYGSMTIGKAIFYVLIAGLSLFVMTWFIQWLCETQHGPIAWIVVLMPFIQVALAVIFS